ncbi:MAG: hypothetical protein H7210_11125, partial [Pyrinomonadaceae bacterium]|nr:hypothetical protein [Phycisphaerales bacterium]
GGSVATGTGGVGTGGISGTGGNGIISTGGTGSGGTGSTAAATGGRIGTGGTATGGTGTGGAGTGGAGTGGAGTGGTSGQRIISIDFVGGQTAMTSTEIAGVKPAARWNNAPGASGSLTAFADNQGNSMNCGLTWTAGTGGVWRLSWPDAPGNTRMMNGYLDPISASAPAKVEVTGLPSSITGSGYDVYVYAYGPLSSGTRTSIYAIGSTSISVTQTGPSASTFTGYTPAPPGGSGNYVVFRGVTGSSFTLTATPGTASGTQTRAPLNGIQIVSPSGS